MKRTFQFLLIISLALVAKSAAASTYPLANILPKDAAQKLADAGITSSDLLLEKGATPAGRQKLAKSTGLSAKQVHEWVLMCDLLRIKGVGPVMTKLLGAAKVNSIAQLRTKKAELLYKEVMKANEKVKITENPPSEKHLEHWIDQAKQLKIIVR
jgi:predicted flap endonuclease-1-like 5' DNA nuclease